MIGPNSLVSLKKDELRNQIRQHWAQISDVVKTQVSLKAQLLLCSLEVFQKASCVALYSPIQKEVSTELIFEEAIKKNKKVCYPKVFWKKNWIEYYEIDSAQRLTLSHWGGKEPRGDTLKVSLDRIDLMVIPALAFDIFGGRLGRGKGFYDRVLKNYHGSRVGLAYSFQVLKELPCEIWDERMDYVVTESKTYQFI